MKKIFLILLGVFPLSFVCSQQLTPTVTSSPAQLVSTTSPATAGDVEALRQQVQSLTETVKALQQQVKDRQAALEKANLTGESGLPENPEPSPIAGAEQSPRRPGARRHDFRRRTRQWLAQQARRLCRPLRLLAPISYQVVFRQRIPLL